MILKVTVSIIPPLKLNGGETMNIDVSVDTVEVAITRDLPKTYFTCRNDFTYISGSTEESKNNPFGACYFKQSDIFTIQYYTLNKLLKVKFSVPRLLFGYNIYIYKDNNFSQLEIEFINKLCKDIDPQLRFLLPPLRYWDVEREDAFCHIYVDDEGEKQSVIDAFKRLHPGRYDKLDFTTSFFIKNKSCRIGFYDKAAQYEKEYPEFNLTKDQRKLIRYEVEYKNRKVNNSFKKGRKVKDLLNIKTATYILQKSIDMLRIENPFRTLEDTLTLIDNNFKGTKCRNLKEFVIFLNEHSTTEAKNKFKSYYRYYKELTEAGINPICLKGNIKQISFNFLDVSEVDMSVIKLDLPDGKRFINGLIIKLYEQLLLGIGNINIFTIYVINKIKSVPVSNNKEIIKFFDDS